MNGRQRDLPHPRSARSYQVTFELQGFSTISRTGVSLLVGQTANVDVQLNPSTLQETVTVTGEAPLLEVATSSIGGNIDQRQMQELPVQGRDWTALALLAPGNPRLLRRNQVQDAPTSASTR